MTRSLNFYLKAMKVVLKLTHRELSLWLAFIMASAPERYRKGAYVYRTVYFAMKRLAVMLRGKVVEQRDKYRISIHNELGAAFIAHCDNTGDIDVEDDAMVTINKIIGIIDQQLN